MGIYYNVDHAIRDRQVAIKVQKQQQEQRRKDFEKARKAAQDAHERRIRGGMY